MRGGFYKPIKEEHEIRVLITSPFFRYMFGTYLDTTREPKTLKTVWR